MATNREILYTIRLRSVAREAVRQLTQDLRAQGETVQQVARKLNELKAGGVGAGAGATAIGKVTKAAQAATKALGATTAATKTLDKTMGKTPGAQALTKQLQDAAKAAVTLAAAMAKTGASGAPGASGKASTKAANTEAADKRAATARERLIAREKELQALIEKRAGLETKAGTAAAAAEAKAERANAAILARYTKASTAVADQKHVIAGLDKAIANAPRAGLPRAEQERSDVYNAVMGIIARQNADGTRNRPSATLKDIYAELPNMSRDAVNAAGMSLVRDNHLRTSQFSSPKTRAKTGKNLQVAGEWVDLLGPGHSSQPYVAPAGQPDAGQTASLYAQRAQEIAKLTALEKQSAAAAKALSTEVVAAKTQEAAELTKLDRQIVQAQERVVAATRMETAAAKEATAAQAAKAAATVKSKASAATGPKLPITAESVERARVAVEALDAALAAPNLGTFPARVTALRDQVRGLAQDAKAAKAALDPILSGSAKQTSRAGSVPLGFQSRLAAAQAIQAAQNGTTTSQAAAPNTSRFRLVTKDLNDMLKALTAANGSSGSFQKIEDAVTRLDRALATSNGLIAYRARLQSIQAVLVQLASQYAATAAAAAAYGGTPPPRAPRNAGGGGSAGAPPGGTAPPRAGGGGFGGGNGSGGANDLNRALLETRTRLDDIRSRMGQIAALTLSAFGAQKVLEMADEYTKVISQLKLVTEGTQNLRDTYEALRKVADDNRTGIGATAEIYAKFNKATRSLGVTQQEVIETTDSVAKAVAIFGGNSQSAGAALFQFSQGLASGTLRGEELNSVMEQAPRLAQAIADGYKNMDGSIGTSIGALRGLAEQGKLTPEVIFNALKNQRGKLEEEYAKTGLTISQAFTVAKNAVIDFVGKADESTGTSKKVGQAILDAVKVLQTPAAISGAQTVLQGFATAVSSALTVVGYLANHLQLVTTAFVILKGIQLAPVFAAWAAGFAGLSASAVGAASSIGIYNIATRQMMVGATVAQAAVAGLNGVMRLFGGPLGLAITAAAGALTYWMTQTKATVETTSALNDATAKLKENYDDATNSVKKLSDAERARETIKLKGAQGDFAKQLKASVGALDAKVDVSFGDGVFEGTTLDQKFKPFQAEIEKLRASAAAGKADFEGFQTAISLKAKGNPELEKTARILLDNSDAGRKAQDGYKQADAALKVLEGTATRTEAAVAGMGTTLREIQKDNPQIAFQDFIRFMKEVAENVPTMNTAQEAQNKLSTATNNYESAIKRLAVAHRDGGITQDKYDQELAQATMTLMRAKDAINGVTQAQRELADAQRDLGMEGMVDRERAIEGINIKYDRTIRSLKEQVQDQEQLNKLVQEQNNLRQQEIGNLDVKFQNGDLRDRLQSMQAEARLLDLTGEARERASRLIEVENAARRAGVSDVQGMVDAYAKEYDALKQAADARQTLGNGFNTAVTQYIENARRVGDESARLFSSTFDNISDGFVDTIKTGRDGFRSMLDSIANDLMRFASRQLFRTLLSSVFGDGQGGTGSGTSFGASILQALGGATNTRTAAPAGSAVSAAVSAVAGFGSTGLNTAASTAASGVVKLSDAASTAAGSFGDIPSKLSSMLKGLGATDAGVAGFLGNVQRESGFDPNAVNPKSGAYGLIQALGPRKTALFEQYGSSPTADQQIEFIRKELQSTEGSSLKMLQNASTLSDGVKAGIRFERPEGYVSALQAGDLSQVPDYGKRMDFARGFGSVSSTAPSVPSLEGATLNDEAVSKLNANFDELSTKTMGLTTDFSQAGNVMASAAPRIENGVAGVSASLQTGSSNVGKAFQDVSSTIVASSSSLQNAFAQMVAKLGSSDGAWGALGGVFNIGKGFAGDGLDLAAGSATSWLHTGGIIGKSARVTGTASTSLWDNAPKFHSGGIVGGLKSRERAIIAKDDEAIFPTVRMGDGQLGIRATGFTGGGGGGGGDINFGDIVIQTNGSSGDAQKDQEHAKGMAREVRASLKGLVYEVMQEQARGGGMLSQTGMLRR